VAFAALSDHLETHTDDRGIILETAHPVKFDSVEEIVGTAGAEPESVRTLSDKSKQSIEIAPDYESVREVLFSKV
jgi:threonine synthase